MAADEDLRYLADLVRSQDRPRYYATLFAPADVRADLFALYGFAAEIARIPEQVQERHLGEIRLQWWHDSLAAAIASSGEGAAPALRALTAAIRRRSLPSAPLLALIDARRSDLYSDPPATVTDVEGYFGETESALFQLASIILGSGGRESADPAGHSGIAYGLTRRLASFAKDRASGGSIVPADLLLAHGLPGDALYLPNLAAAPLREILGDLCGLADWHLREAERGLRILPRSVRPAFLPLAVTAGLLARVRALGASLAEHPAELSDLGSLIRLGWRRMQGSM